MVQYFSQEANYFVKYYLVAADKLVYIFKVQKFFYDSLVDETEDVHQINILEYLL